MSLQQDQDDLELKIFRESPSQASLPTSTGNESNTEIEQVQGKASSGLNPVDFHECHGISSTSTLESNETFGRSSPELLTKTVQTVDLQVSHVAGDSGKKVTGAESASRFPKRFEASHPFKSRASPLSTDGGTDNESSCLELSAADLCLRDDAHLCVLVQVPPRKLAQSKIGCPPSISRKHFDNGLPLGNAVFEARRESFILENVGQDDCTVQGFIDHLGIKQKPESDEYECVKEKFRFFGTETSINRPSLEDRNFLIPEIKSYSILKKKIKQRWQTAVKKHRDSFRAEEEYNTDESTVNQSPPWPKRLRKSASLDDVSDPPQLVAKRLRRVVSLEDMLDQTLPDGSMAQAYQTLVCSLEEFQETQSSDGDILNSWAREWAVNFKQNTPQAVALNSARITLWKFLFDLRRFELEEIKETFDFDPMTLPFYLEFCLTLERARVLYASSTNSPLSFQSNVWFSHEHTCKTGTIPPSGFIGKPTLARWMVDLVRGLGLDDTLGKYLEPAGRSEAESRIVVP